jgi:hypothetical protein
LDDLAEILEIGRIRHFSARRRRRARGRLGGGSRSNSQELIELPAAEPFPIPCWLIVGTIGQAVNAHADEKTNHARHAEQSRCKRALSDLIFAVLTVLRTAVSARGATGMKNQ